MCPASMLSRSLPALCASALVLAACPAHEDETDTSGALVVGVQADDFGGLVGSVHVVVKNDGRVVSDELAGDTVR